MPRIIEGTAAAYQAAWDDGWRFASSIYSHPRARLSLANLLRKAREAEAAGEDWQVSILTGARSKERWRYDPERGLLCTVCGSEEHALYHRRSGTWRDPA